MRKKKKQRKKKNVLNRILGFLLALVLLAGGKLFLRIGLLRFPTAIYPSGFPISAARRKKILAVYYVDVGQGDAAVVVCDGKTLVYRRRDGRRRRRALFVYAATRWKTEQVDFYVATPSAC